MSIIDKDKNKIYVHYQNIHASGLERKETEQLGKLYIVYDYLQAETPWVLQY